MVDTVFKLVYDDEWQEFQVQVFEDNILNENSTYHTDDEEDAQLTMIEMRREE